MADEFPTVHENALVCANCPHWQVLHADANGTPVRDNVNRYRVGRCKASLPRSYNLPDGKIQNFPWMPEHDSCSPGIVAMQERYQAEQPMNLPGKRYSEFTDDE